MNISIALLIVSTSTCFSVCGLNGAAIYLIFLPSLFTGIKATGPFLTLPLSPLLIASSFNIMSSPFILTLPLSIIPLSATVTINLSSGKASVVCLFLVLSPSDFKSSSVINLPLPIYSSVVSVNSPDSIRPLSSFSSAMLRSILSS